ncbi:MAG: CBS domain-containing protein [Deltaproteobacteria bacterium]|nr:MAG: CBS domain-containing protein [Deltaproteobacteria bacterium]
MQTAQDILDPNPLTVSPDTRVDDLARKLLEAGREGACVVDDAGRLIGVVTAMDLVYKEKRLHLPTLFTFMDAVIPLGWKRAERELEKIAGITVGQIMTRDVVTVGPGAGLDEIATLMVDKHLTMLPVVDGDRLLGVVDKRAVLAAAFASSETN